MDKHNTRYVLHNVKHLYSIYSRLYYQVYPEQTFGTIKLRMKKQCKSGAIVPDKSANPAS